MLGDPTGIPGRFPLTAVPRKSAALPTHHDTEWLFWFAGRMVHVYRLDAGDPLVDRVVAIAQALPWNHSTTIINTLPDAGSLHSAYDGEFLHALARLLVERFREPEKSDIVIRLRAIANALPARQKSQ